MAESYASMRQHHSVSLKEKRSRQVAVVGAGYWGRKVIRELLDLSRSTGLVNVAAIVDNSPISLEQCAEEFGPLDYRLDHVSLLTDPTVDAVHICSPNPSHYEIAAAFIKHGKNVLIEKPMTLHAKEAWALVRLAKERNVVLSIGSIHRFNNGLRNLRRALLSGDLGRPYYLKLMWTGFLPPQAEREVVTDLTPHPFDICNFLLDQWPIRISCWGNALRANTQELAFINCEFQNGPTAHIEVSWLDPEKHREVTIIGSKGVALLDCLDQRLIIRGPDGPRELTTRPSNVLREEIVHFVDCMLANRRSENLRNLIDGSLGARVVSMIEAARESQLENTVVAPRFPSLATKEVTHNGKSVLEMIEGPSGVNLPVGSLETNSFRSRDRIFLSELMILALEAKLRGSRHRIEILRGLAASDKSPKELAKDAGLDISNLAKYVRDLTDYGLVERKTPSNIRKGKIYGVTMKGRSMLERLSKAPQQPIQNPQVGAPGKS